jgi:medium-chain acyl-[acyl-carrier-protein] hydrolase
LAALGRRAPIHLFASGAGAPHLRRAAEPLHAHPDAEFLARGRALGGTPAEVFDAPELLAAVLPALRADFAVCETYAHQPGPPLACPITAFGGLHDRLVARERVLAWRAHTTGAFRVRMIAGDHFFIRGEPLAVLQRIAAELVSPQHAREAS